MEDLIQKRIKEELRFRFKLFIVELAELSKCKKKTLQEYNVSKSTYYSWKVKYDKYGKSGLRRRKPVSNSHPRKISSSTIEKILEMRKEYQMGPKRIMWYLERYHGINISQSSVSRTLVKYGVNKLSKTSSRRIVHSKRYSKSVPGHHVQVDVRFLTFNDHQGRKIKRYQYTAIDDATRIRALKIYNKHNQKSSINFIDYVVDKFPFRINTIRTDRGHEFQALFHWHVEDNGMRHVYIKARTPQLNGKVERSHRTDKDEFYQLLSYTDDVDLNEKLKSWEHFYNFNRPHTAFDGKTPYEALKLLIQGA
ncbi:MAG: IS481 family transposase [Bacteroidota bacterium]